MTDADRAELLCCRSEWRARTAASGGAEAVDEWAADADAALALDRRSARVWLAVARARCAQRRWGDARDAVGCAIERAERASDPATGHEALRLQRKLEQRQ